MCTNNSVIVSAFVHVSEWIHAPLSTCVCVLKADAWFFCPREEQIIDQSLWSPAESSDSLMLRTRVSSGVDLSKGSRALLSLKITAEMQSDSLITDIRRLFLYTFLPLHQTHFCLQLLSHASPLEIRLYIPVCFSLCLYTSHLMCLCIYWIYKKKKKITPELHNPKLWFLGMLVNKLFSNMVVTFAKKCFLFFNRKWIHYTSWCIWHFQKEKQMAGLQAGESKHPHGVSKVTLKVFAEQEDIFKEGPTHDWTTAALQVGLTVKVRKCHFFKCIL